eukprot:1917-Heterococcus_DN1.PRE.1
MGRSVRLANIKFMLLANTSVCCQLIALAAAVLKHELAMCCDQPAAVTDIMQYVMLWCTAFCDARVLG